MQASWHSFRCWMSTACCSHFISVFSAVENSLGGIRHLPRIDRVGLSVRSFYLIQVRKIVGTTSKWIKLHTDLYQSRLEREWKQQEQFSIAHSQKTEQQAGLCINLPSRLNTGSNRCFSLRIWVLTAADCSNIWPVLGHSYRHQSVQWLYLCD